MKSNSGFTLIELLIVIAIIGILAAVLIPNLTGARARAYKAQAQACAKAIATYQEVYQIDYGVYTNSVPVGTDPSLRPCSEMSIVAGSATSTNYSFLINNRGERVSVTQDGIR